MSDIDLTQAAFAVSENGTVVIDTVSQTEGLAKLNWLCFHSGDYELENFFHGEGSLDLHHEFDHYPNVAIVPVWVVHADAKVMQ